jgi:hypothetical protein
VHSVSDVTQLGIHTVEPLVRDPSHLEVEITKFKRYKSPGSDQIRAVLIQAGGEILLSAIRKLINSIWNKKELRDSGKSLLLYPFTKAGPQLTAVIIV